MHCNWLPIPWLRVCGMGTLHEYFTHDAYKDEYIEDEDVKEIF
jgi:hypothetical protein